MSGEYQVRTIPLPPESVLPVCQANGGRFKWLRGVVCDGYLYGIPAWATAGVLRVDIAALWGRRRRGGEEGAEEEKAGGSGGARACSPSDAVRILPLPLDTFAGNDGEDGGGGVGGGGGRDRVGASGRRWLWHGASLDRGRTAIYCIPSNATSVLKVDLNTMKCSLLRLLESSTPVDVTNKWYGGLLGGDDAVYGVPYAASGVLRIDCRTNAVTILGEFGFREYNWHGGVKAGNGCIYAHPAHSSYALKIDTSPRRPPPASSVVADPNDDDENDDDDGEGRLTLLPIRRASYDTDRVTRYKWLGGALGADGNVYNMPSDASSILVIDTKTDMATTFGYVEEGKNKWQGGVCARNGFVYAVPADAGTVLQIDTRPIVGDDDGGGMGGRGGERREEDMRGRVRLVGDLPLETDKWQGGFAGRDGCIYAIPENFHRIMKLTPSRPEDVYDADSNGEGGGGGGGAGGGMERDEVAIDFL